MALKVKLLSKVGSFLSVAMFCVACGGGGGASTASLPAPTPTAAPPTPTPPATPAQVTISGSVTFQDVPVNTFTNGLDYDNIQNLPVRGVTIEALDANDAIVETGQTGQNGEYSFTVASNTPIRIRAKAQMVQTAGATWDVRVQDNTSAACVITENSPATLTDNTFDCPIYVLDGALVTSGAANSTRDLNADAGWGTTSYVRPRVSGPFAILSPIFDALQDFEAVAPAANFPAVAFNWSVNNRSAGGNIANGDIGTSSYVSNIRPNGLPTENGGPGIFILGEANADTDEFDEDVVVHEWGHYFEDQLSRSDSIGGAHGLGDRLDFRVAFSEGFGNALSAIVNDDVLYRDTSGAQQSRGFFFNVEGQAGVPNDGWFSETSAQEIIYDIFDTANDAGDSVSLGLAPIFNALTSTAYTQNTVFTTLFSFMGAVIDQNAGDTAGLTALLTQQNIAGSGPEGAGETNDGGIAQSLPVYKNAIINGPAVIVCSTDNGGVGSASSDFNNLGTRDFITFTRVSLAPVTLTAQLIPNMSDTTNNDTGAEFDPDFFIFRQGIAVASATAIPANSETLTSNLQGQIGDFVIDFFDFDNVDETLGADDPRDDGDSCYNFTITQ